MFLEKKLVNILKKITVEVGKGFSDSSADTGGIAEGLDADTGVAWVQEGIIFVRDPEGEGRLATITPGQGVELYVNGVLQDDETQVSSKDYIEAKLAKKEFAGKFRLELTKDEMEANLIVEPTRIFCCKLVSQHPQQNLFLKTVIQESLESPLDIDQLNEMLIKEGISTGIDLSGALHLLSNPENAKVTVARGLPPEPPVDEKVEILYPQDSKHAPSIKEDGTVDFYNIENIVCVEEGALLAYKKPGIPGKPGQNVRSETVMPQLPRLAVLRAGKGAALSEDGAKVFAKRSGRPVSSLEGQIYTIGVEDVLIHKGDVDIGTGNLRFKGSLLKVCGNVQDSMTVRATGVISIDGIVSGARVIAYDNIYINGNTTNSVISAGIDESLLQRLLSYISNIENNFKKLIEILSVLSAQEKVKNEKVNYGYLLKLVIEEKLKDVPESVAVLNKLYESSFIDLPDEVVNVMLLAGKVMANPYKFASEEALLNLLQGVKYVREYFVNRSKTKANLEVGGVVNSRLLATGDVIVKKQGCFNTVIQAGGNLNINGVFRGGEIRAGGNVLIFEAGTESGVKTVIEAGEKSVVRINQCNEGVTIKLGATASQIIGKAKGLVAALDKNGALQLE